MAARRHKANVRFGSGGDIKRVSGLGRVRKTLSAASFGVEAVKISLVRTQKRILENSPIWLAKDVPLVFLS